MTTFTIEVPATWGVASRETGVEVDVTRLSPEIVGKLAMHGLTQKVADAAAGAVKGAGFDVPFNQLTEDEKAKVRAWAKEAMASVTEALYQGSWTERRAGEAVDPLTAAIRTVFYARLRADKAPAYAKLKDMDARDRGPALDGLFTKLESVNGAVHAELLKAAKRRVATAKEEAKLTVGTLDL